MISITIAWSIGIKPLAIEFLLRQISWESYTNEYRVLYILYIEISVYTIHIFNIRYTILNQLDGPVCASKIEKI